MFPSNITGIACPGCASGDFPQPHICGSMIASIASGFCYLCNQPWMGYHVCTGRAPMVQPRPCEHCFCDDAVSFGGQKPHEVCCMCATRRVKA